jgi:hypothetical protein
MCIITLSFSSLLKRVNISTGLIFIVIIKICGSEPSDIFSILVVSRIILYFCGINLIY